MGITHVVRAEEHLTNSLRQCLILDALEFSRPQYAHCSLILGEDRSKLSKRHGATSVGQFRQEVIRTGGREEVEPRCIPIDDRCTVEKRSDLPEVSVEAIPSKPAQDRWRGCSSVGSRPDGFGS